MTSLRGNRGLKLNRMPVVDALTPVEAQIWMMLQDGKPRKEIADALSLKKISVDRRIPIIYEKIAAQRY